MDLIRFSGDVVQSCSQQSFEIESLVLEEGLVFDADDGFLHRGRDLRVIYVGPFLFRIEIIQLIPVPVVDRSALGHHIVGDGLDRREILEVHHVDGSAEYEKDDEQQPEDVQDDEFLRL